MITISRAPMMFLSLFVLTGILLSGCSGAGTKDSDPSSPTAAASLAETATANACPVTEPLWVKPPDDAAVSDSPEPGHYFVNEDRSIWASAWWTGEAEYQLRAGEEGNKVGWFRPAGVDLAITGQRLDAQSSPLEAHIPCCYPTRFQSTGLYFPTEGCWKVAAKAADSALSFVVWVAP